MLLGLAIGALETMPDRGELLDWFGATEIIAEAVIAAFAFYLFMERGRSRPTSAARAASVWY